MDDLKKKAEEMRRSGMSISKIAKELGVSPKTVWRWFNPEKNEESLKKFEERVVKKFQSGELSILGDKNLVLKEMAVKLGLSVHTIRKYRRILIRRGLIKNRRENFRYPKEVVEKAISLVKDGLSFHAAGREVGASANAVMRWCRKAGVYAEMKFSEPKVIDGITYVTSSLYDEYMDTWRELWKLDEDVEKLRRQYRSFKIYSPERREIEKKMGELEKRRKDLKEKAETLGGMLKTNPSMFIRIVDLKTL